MKSVSDDHRFGYPKDLWERMVDAGHGYLERLAFAKGHTDYTTFCHEVALAAGSAPQPGDHSLAHLLGDIARRSASRFKRRRLANEGQGRALSLARR